MTIQTKKYSLKSAGYVKMANEHGELYSIDFYEHALSIFSRLLPKDFGNISFVDVYPVEHFSAGWSICRISVAWVNSRSMFPLLSSYHLLGLPAATNKKNDSPVAT